MRQFTGVCMPFKCPFPLPREGIIDADAVISMRASQPRSVVGTGLGTIHKCHNVRNNWEIMQRSAQVVRGTHPHAE